MSPEQPPHPHRRITDVDPKMPHRRSTDPWYINIRDNWYRDLWLLIITIVVVLIGLKALSVSTRANNLSQTIQKQRVASTLSNCRDQNSRNRNTINFLDGLANKLDKKHPSEAKKVRMSLAQDKLLIDALAPYRNCEKLVKKSTGGN